MTDEIPGRTASVFTHIREWCIIAVVTTGSVLVWLLAASFGLAMTVLTFVIMVGFPLAIIAIAIYMVVQFVRWLGGF